jgi:hypothetical protein
MKTKRFHKGNLGMFGASLPADFHGYVEVHDSPRYEKMTKEELMELESTSRFPKVRSACVLEIAERNLAKWQGN